MSTNDVLQRVAATRMISADDALLARRSVYGGDAIIDPREVEMLFKIDEAADRTDPSWTALITEATVDYLVNQVEPHGYVDAANADWLTARIAKDGKVKTATELEVLVKVIEAARSVPEALVAFALGQVKACVVSGDGPLASGGHCKPGQVSREEADLVRRILYAYGGDGGIAISRREAEMLFDINDATDAAANDPAWDDLFVKAIANCMMAASGYQVPPREVALEREHWLDRPSEGVGGLFARLAEGGFRGVLAAYKAPGGEDAMARMNAEMDARIRAAEVVGEGEAKWLAGRIGHDGDLRENEKALLRFIAEQSPDVHPSLQPLLAKAA